MYKLYVIGANNNGLAMECGQIIKKCTCAFAADRFVYLLKNFSGPTYPLSPLKQALNVIEEKLASGSVAVLASGDPLFFGIGKTLIKKFGSECVEIIPAVSSMQMAFARFKIPWSNAVFHSLHGRKTKSLTSTILSNPTTFLFTDSQNTFLSYFTFFTNPSTRGEGGLLSFSIFLLTVFGNDKGINESSGWLGIICILKHCQVSF